MSDAEHYRIESDVRFKQWQAALRRVGKMRDALVALGVTDPEILGQPVVTFEVVKSAPMKLDGVELKDMDWTSTSWAASTAHLSDESRDLVWNIPNEKGETVQRRVIPAGKWARRRDSVRALVPGLFGTGAIIPLAELEYHDGGSLDPAYRPSAPDPPLIVGS